MNTPVTYGPFHAGTGQVAPGWSTGQVRAIRANLWNYNPDEVEYHTSFWVMVYQDATHYSQVGWFKDKADQDAAQPEHLYSEYNDSSDPYAFVRRFYNESTGTWGTSKATSPSSSVLYQTNWIMNGAEHQAQNIYNGAKSQNISVSWVPTYYAVDGEIDRYSADVNGNHYGDHGVGDTTTHMRAEYIQYYSDAGSWTDGASYTYRHDGPYGNDTNATGTGYDIWDTRCSN